MKNLEEINSLKRIEKRQIQNQRNRMHDIYKKKRNNS
jgi:hypothetical protein